MAAPLLLPGDTLDVVRCDPDQIAPGDVVLFRGLVVHRFLYATADGLIARRMKGRTGSDRLFGGQLDRITLYEA